MRSTFDEFTAVKAINKLKKDLKNTREDLRDQIVQKNKLKTYFHLKKIFNFFDQIINLKRSFWFRLGR